MAGNSQDAAQALEDRFALTSASTMTSVAQRFLTQISVDPNETSFVFFTQSLDWLLHHLNQTSRMSPSLNNDGASAKLSPSSSLQPNDMFSVPCFQSLHIEDAIYHDENGSTWTYEPSEEVFHLCLTSTCLPLRNLTSLYLRSLKSCESSVLGFIKLCPQLSSLFWFADDNSCFSAYLKEQPRLEEVGFLLSSSSDEILYCLSSLKHRPKRIEVHSPIGTTFSAKFPPGWANHAHVVNFSLSTLLSSVVRSAWTEAAEVFSDFLEIPPHRARFQGRCAMVLFMYLLPIKATIGLIQEIYRNFVPLDLSFPERLAVLRDIVYNCRSRGWSEHTVMRVTEWAASEASSHCNGDNLQRLLLLATVFDFGGSSGFQFQGLSLIDALRRECPKQTFEHVEWAVAQVNRFAASPPSIFSILATNQDSYAALDCTIFDLAVLDSSAASRVRGRMSEHEFYEQMERSKRRVDYLQIFHPTDPLWKLALAYFDPAQSKLTSVPSLADAILLPDRISSLLTSSLSFGQAISVLGADTIATHPVVVGHLFRNKEDFLHVFMNSRKVFTSPAAERAFRKHLTLASPAAFVEVFPTVAVAFDARRSNPLWEPLFDKFPSVPPSRLNFVDAWMHAPVSSPTPGLFKFWLHLHLRCLTDNSFPSWFIQRYAASVLGSKASRSRIPPDLKIGEDVLNQFIRGQPEAGATLLFSGFPEFSKPSRLAEHVLGYVNASLAAKPGDFPLKCLYPVMFRLVQLDLAVDPKDVPIMLDLLFRLVDTNNLELIKAALDCDPNFAHYSRYPGNQNSVEGDVRPGWVLESVVRKGDLEVLDLLLRRTSFEQPLTRLLNLVGNNSFMQSILLQGSVDAIRHVLFAFAHSSALLYDIFCPSTTSFEMLNAKIIQARAKDLSAIFTLPTHDWLWEAVPSAWCAFIGFPLQKISQRSQYDAVISYYSSVEASVAKLLIRISSTLLSPFAQWLSQQQLYASERRTRCIGLFRDLVFTHLNLLAARQNWDGFLSTTISLQKSLASTKIPITPDLFSAACMCANLKLGNELKARKYAQQLEFGPLQYFVYLDAEASWKRLTASSESSQGDAARKANLSSPSAPSSSSSSLSSSTNNLVAGTSSPPSSAATKGKAKKNAANKKSISEPASASSTPVMSPKAGNSNAPSSSSSSSSSTTSPPSKKASAVAKPSPPKQASAGNKLSSSSNSIPPSVPSAIAPASPPPSHQQQAASRPPSRKSPDAALLYLSCPICFDSLPDHGIIPCGHMFCGDCLEGLETCAICRERISSTIKMFFSQGDNSDETKKE